MPIFRERGYELSVDPLQKNKTYFVFEVKAPQAKGLVHGFLYADLSVKKQYTNTKMLLQGNYYLTFGGNTIQW